MGPKTAVTSMQAGEIPADVVYALADELGLGQRQLEEWRARGIVPRPRKAGYQGKRPIWVYPARTDKQLRAAVRWRKGTRNLDAIKVALWTDAFPIPVADVRASLTVVVDAFERAMLRDIGRFAPPGAHPETLMDDEQALRAALAGYTDELARKRASSPLTHRVRMTLAERQRAFLYMLAPFFGTEQQDGDAALAERLYGISRGRSGTAKGLLPDPPEEYVRVNPLTPRIMRAALEKADDGVYAFVRAAFFSFNKLLPALLPILVPPASPLRQFSDDALTLIQDTSAEGVALFVAAMIANVERQSESEELSDEILESVKLNNLARQIFTALGPDQQEQFVKKLSP